MQVVLLFILTSGCIYSRATKMPPTFQKCALEDPNFPECFTRAISDAIGQLTKQFPKVGLQILDPLDIPTLSIERTGTKTLDVSPHFTNLKMYGYSKLRVDKAELGKDKKYLTIEGFLPEFRQIGHYQINGTVLQVSVHGNGQSQAYFYNTSVVNTFFFDEYEKEGQKHWKVTKTDLKFLPESAKFDFENLLGDDASSEIMNKMINDNSKDLYAAGRSTYEAALAAVHQRIANIFFSKVPIFNIFN